jgi:predicted metalloprotease with PDZ domain
VITAVNRRPIGNRSDWQAAVAAHKPGETISVEFTRHGVASRTKITLVEDPRMEVVTLESTGATLSADQKRMREAWLASRRR